MLGRRKRLLTADQFFAVVGRAAGRSPILWTRREVARGDDLILTDPAVTLTAAEIFGGG